MFKNSIYVFVHKKKTLCSYKNKEYKRQAWQHCYNLCCEGYITMSYPRPFPFMLCSNVKLPNYISFIQYRNVHCQSLIKVVNTRTRKLKVCLHVLMTCYHKNLSEITDRKLSMILWRNGYSSFFICQLSFLVSIKLIILVSIESCDHTVFLNF